MTFSQILSIIAPLGILITGILIKFSKREDLQSFKRRWLLFVVIGGLLLTYRIYKLWNGTL